MQGDAWTANCTSRSRFDLMLHAHAHLLFDHTHTDRQTGVRMGVPHGLGQMYHTGRMVHWVACRGCDQSAVDSR